ncbi:MaoC family dehydratase [Alkalihalobacillus oceani]|uniref:MaoC family dehydratase n=1 Tax=Halalkalibacter oceani TaxID=1653776 RepID=A0A9X2IPY4_9BACI|nr:MaoC family dehydratase [Halalkalibacter oceani]MCM3716509.1 MaoC family dehydratase [Halalkalibacter oceani]
MNSFENFKIGDEVEFSKTVSETDVYMFAGITGDFSPNHVNEEFMQKTPYKKRIAHGALAVGFISTASYLMIERKNIKAVSYGYDKVRFTKPIFIGDTITVKYQIEEIDKEKLRTVASCQVFNQHGEVCTVAQHILYHI